MKLFLTYKVWREGKHYVAYSPELEVASQGKTREAAERMIKEAIRLFLDSARKKGTLSEILESAGFVRKERRWLAPSISISSMEVLM